LTSNKEAKLANYSSFAEKVADQLRAGDERRDFRLDLDGWEREIEGQLASVF
jgi:hypothetical protein